MKKKNTKNKKQKIKGLKTKWKTWMTVLAVVGGVFLVSGVTVLGVYLAGGFEEDVISPENIKFSLGDNRFENNQLEVQDDFEIVLTSDTATATQRKVRLSFEGAGSTLVKDGKISNQIIEVPQTVYLGTPFTVHLLKTALLDSEGNRIQAFGNDVDWIKGGLSTLVATSEYNQIPSVKVNIAVDVPVYATETVIYNSLGEEVSQVVKNEKFTVKTRFIPASSEYLFSDDLSNKPENEKRKKLSFYEAVSTENLTAHYENKTSLYFMAADTIASDININSYTFANALAQLQFQAENAEVENAELYYTTALTYLNEHTNDAKQSSATISIGDEDIGNFTLAKEGQTISMKAETPLNLYLNDYPYIASSSYLGVQVFSASGRLLDGLLPNVALTFSYKGSDPTTGDFKILDVQGGSVVTLDGVNYYKPYSDVNDLRYSYFTLSATQSAEISVSLFLLTNDDTKLFEQISGTPFSRNFILSISKHEEKPPVWSGENQIEVLLDYVTVGGTSTVAPKTINLSQYVSVDSENIYRDYVFFASFGTGEIEDNIAKANACIGPNGYILSRSGKYSTGGGMTLFAIDGNSITLYSTGEFTVYVATVKPTLDTSGLYSIVEMASGYKRIICEKSLYTDSVESIKIDTTNFEADVETNEISINQGNESTLGLLFSVNADSVPVFRDEFQKGYIYPNVYDTTGNDISELFTFDEGNLINEDDGTLTVEYRLSAKPSVGTLPLDGVYLGFGSLTYNNTVDQPIKWMRELKPELNPEKICIYKPTAQNIDLADSDVKRAIIERGESIIVEQTLASDGEFRTSISLTLENGDVRTFNSVNELITSLVGNEGAFISIVDQKKKTNTLNGEWKFVVASGLDIAVSISADGKSFSFRNTESEDFLGVTLIIQSTDGNATVKNGNENLNIAFSVKSTGITKITFDSEIHTYLVNRSNQSEDTSKAVINKYGAKGEAEQYLNLSELVKFYCQGEQEYTYVQFKLNPQYYSSTNLSETRLLDLYGENGMLTLMRDGVNILRDDFTAENIRRMLASESIDQIKINKNFASSHTLQLLAFDASGAVNTSVEITLQSNISLTNVSYEQYAGSEFSLTNTVTNNDKETDTDSIDTLYDGQTYYIILDNTDGRYKLQASVAAIPGAIGEYRPASGKIKFYDFWEDESKYITVYFEPEGGNAYSISQPISFTINRDMVVNDLGKIFYTLAEAGEIADYVTVTRNDGTLLSDIALEYTFADYLELNLGKVQSKANADFFFDYNVQKIYTTLTISYAGTTFGNVSIEIQPCETDDFYKMLAGRFKSRSIVPEIKGMTPRIQFINDVEYLVFPSAAGMQWEYDKLTDETYGIKINCYQMDRDNNKLTSLYSVINSSYLKFTSQNLLLSGLNEKNKFIYVEFVVGESKTSMYVPVIISNIGFDSVIYDSAEDYTRSLERALMRPEQLIEKGLYNEIYAGQTTDILFSYDLLRYKKTVTLDNGTDLTTWDNNITDGGLYLINKDTLKATLSTYLLDSTYENYASLLKSYDLNNISADKNGTITLNHLPSTESKAYIAFVYTIQDSRTNDKQAFYYVLKVLPDVVVEEPVYAYGGTQEFIKGNSTTNSTIDLEELFNNRTLHNQEKRFMVSKIINLANEDKNLTISNLSEKSVIKFTAGDAFKIVTFETESALYDVAQLMSGATSVKVSIISGDAVVSYNGVEQLRTLEYKNEITSVVVGEKTMYTSQEWSKYVALSLSEDYRTLTYRPIGNERIMFTIKHTYQGGEGKSVLKAEQYYTFVLNDNEDVFKVRFTNDGKATESDNYEVFIRNGSVAPTTAGSETTYPYTLNIDLVRKEESGSTIGTVVYDKLKIDPIDESLAQGENAVIAGYNYSNSKENNGLFTLYLKDYIDSDKEISFAVYIEQGYLATLTFVLKANIEYDSSKSVTQLLGGTETNLLTATHEITVGATKENVPFFYLNNADVAGCLSSDWYSVQAEIDSKDAPYIKFEDNTLKVSDLIQDRQATIKFTLTFNASSGTLSGKQFVFSQVYTLLSNIIPNENVSSSSVTIAGQPHQINLGDLLNKNYVTETKSLTDADAQTMLKNASFKINAASTSPAFKGISVSDTDVKTIKVETNYVASTTTLQLELALSIPTFDGETTQNLTLSYSFVIYPSVQLSQTYPQPNSQTAMTYEYIEDGATFEELTTLLTSKPSFAEHPRIVVKGANPSAEYVNDVEIDTSLFKVLINSKSENAIVKQNGSQVAVNSVMKNDSDIVFERGSSSALEATVQLSITYQGVSCTYDIKIVKNSMSLKLNTVTNYTSMGELAGSSVSYEKIYVDKVNPNNIFAGERLVHVQTSDLMATYANEYYFVFEQSGKLKASYPIYIGSTDAGKTLYYDLGQSFADGEFVGLYLVSDFEKAQLQIATDRIIKKASAAINEEDLPSNFSRFILKEDENGKPWVKLANRIQLVYGVDENGNDILVDYAKYYSACSVTLPELNITTFPEDTSSILQASINISWAYNNGSTNETTNFTTTYCYKVAIDIAVGEEATSLHNFITLEVNQEYPSLNTLLNIYHPTTNRKVSAGDFSGAGDGIAFEVLDYSAEASTRIPIADDYLSHFKLSSFKSKAGRDANTIYLFNSAIRNGNVNKCIYDYSVIPFGAKNTGDYLLGKITYTSSRFTETFYVVIKIVPDYVVTYAGSQDNATLEDNGNIISNIDNVDVISTIEETGGFYTPFTLAGDEGFLSIKHKNGTSEKNELSVSAFELTMKQNVTIDGITYNDSENEDKIFRSDANTEWKLSGDTRTYTGTSNVKFAKVREVVFGDQYYMFEGVDAYGYKYRMYFMLQASQRTPLITNTISVVEGDYIDFGVQYQEIKPVAAGNPTTVDGGTTWTRNYNISASTLLTPHSEDIKVKLLTFAGINAWQFDRAYAEVAWDGTKYVGKTGITDTFEGREITYSAQINDPNGYLQYPNINDISIVSVKLYNPVTGEKVKTGLGAEMNEIRRKDSTGAEPGKWQFATGEGNFNGKTRDVYGAPVNTSNYSPYLWKMPVLQDTDIYNGAHSATVRLVVRLAYKSETDVEYSDCSVDITVTRQAQISQAENRVVQDGVDFAVLDQIQSDASAGGAKIKSFVNDTLEVLVPASTTVTFDLELQNGGEILEQATISQSNLSSNFARTFYISLSEQFRRNVQPGQTVVISNVSDSRTEFYYITDVDSRTTAKTFTDNKAKFTIGAIVRDIVYVENAALLGTSGSYGITKHYIAVCWYNNRDAENYYYRASANYAVTGRVYKLKRTFDGEIGFNIKATNNVATLDNWKSAFELYCGRTNGAAGIELSETTVDPSDILNYLRFSLDTSDSQNTSIGKAEITEGGKITLDSVFGDDQYIKVVVELKVSGTDRNITAGDSKDDYLKLATLNLSKIRPETPSPTI